MTRMFRLLANHWASTSPVTVSSLPFQSGASHTDVNAISSEATTLDVIEPVYSESSSLIRRLEAEGQAPMLSLCLDQF